VPIDLILEESWPYVFFAFELFAVGTTTVHVLLNKRNVSSAIGWVGLIWLAPIVGPIFYVMLGINRVKRRALRERPQPSVSRATLESSGPSLRDLAVREPALGEMLAAARVKNAFPLTPGNAIDALVTGDIAYPAMIDAIEQAKRSVVMATYIFDYDAAGLMFADALEAAVRRGVAVRVLIDSVGARYSTPSMIGTLRRRGIRTAAFLRSLVPWRMPYWNLRNHRKVLVVDGRIGFTGGMNIREGCLLARHPRHPVRDTHFRIRGPVVQHLCHAFAEDWAFTTRETLTGDAFFPTLEAAGDVIARGVPDGPDYDFERLLWKRFALVSQAKERVRIVSPYFVPEMRLLAALELAALRGLDVDIVVPEVNNLRFVQWAAMHQLRSLVEAGCSVYLSPPPFDHTKLFVVDGRAAMVGSGNWDTRSHRLNFELDVECYGQAFARTVDSLIDERVDVARRLTVAELDRRGLATKVRDGAAWLLSPYL
jgi:cardiolipin synthase